MTAVPRIVLNNAAEAGFWPVVCMLRGRVAARVERGTTCGVFTFTRDAGLSQHPASRSHASQRPAISLLVRSMTLSFSSVSVIGNALRLRQIKL